MATVSPVITPTLTGRSERSAATLARIAFLATLRRDIVVTARDFIPFLVQVLVQPLFLLFIFGKVLPSIGETQGNFAALLLPGVVALTSFLASMQGVTLPLVLDLGFAREIDDRLLAPMPTSLVAVEKILFAALRGIIAGSVIFPSAWLILGNQYQVRTDAIPGLIGMILLTSCVGASLGLVIGTLIKPEQVGLMFAVILTPLLFTGCTYYPWASLDGIKWFQIVTLFNPLTYAAEGTRAMMVPPIHGHALTTLATPWVLLGLIGPIIAFTFLGMWTFRRRVIN
jgi:ABC-2 type transport system permease protein